MMQALLTWLGNHPALLFAGVAVLACRMLFPKRKGRDAGDGGGGGDFDFGLGGDCSGD
jgi:hypothetical protein